MPRQEKQPVHHVQMNEGKRNLILVGAAPG